MLSISNLSYYIGGRPLFEDASLHVRPKDRIGLIGLNGRGKSTLLRLIHGDMKYDGGEISMSNDCTVGFLNQDQLSYSSERAILDVAMDAFEEAVKLHEKIENIINKLETAYSDNLVEQLTKAQERYETLDGYSLQAKAEEVLEGIGFATSDLKRPLNEFSGGWRMRVILAKLLLENPSLLMLDEPTNHLDLPSIQWLENYLRNYEGAVIIVSHDRHFLDATVNRTVEVANQQLNVYEGNYSFYLEEKELRKEIQQNAYENQQQKIKQTERFIERFRAKATKARQVQSKVKMLDKMDKVEATEEDLASISFKFSASKTSGKHVMVLENIHKAYGEQVIFDNSTAVVNRGDKIALIGANGKGKSTLLRIIANSEKFDGKRQEGHNVEMGFYAQHQVESLNVENEILDELKQAGSDKTELELRGLLGCFLFTDDDVFKKIKVLSGGEKSRVALAKTLISEANFLLLDEPTNHLDFLSENVLIQALGQYQGTFITVSHNRYFINNVANKIWYIEDHNLKEYPGTYQEFEHFWSQRMAQKQVKDKAQEQEKKNNQPKPVEKQSSPDKEEQRKQQKMKKELEHLEAEIMQRETTIKNLEGEMAKPDVYGDHEKLSEIQQKYDQEKNKLEELNTRWESLAEEILD
ncbi:MAG: ribosomal protection-like ABC-F family protein [Candidatus Cyclobacteriaceae bacterium M2_1C_046]